MVLAAVVDVCSRASPSERGERRCAESLDTWVHVTTRHAIGPLFDLPDAALEFEREAGQTDATLHHAYERAFALVAQRRGYRLVDTKAVQ